MSNAMRTLTKWISKRYTKVSRRRGKGKDENTLSEVGEEQTTEVRQQEKRRRVTADDKRSEGQPQPLHEEDEQDLDADELWLETLPRRRHPLGFVLAPSRAYALVPSKDTRWIEEQNSIMFKM